VDLIHGKPRHAWRCGARLTPRSKPRGVGPCTPRGARPTSSSPVSAVALSTSRGWSAASQSSTAPASSTSRGWFAQAKSPKAPAPSSAAARPAPSAAASVSHPYTPNPNPYLKGKGKDKSSERPPKHASQKGGFINIKAAPAVRGRERGPIEGPAPCKT